MRFDVQAISRDFSAAAGRGYTAACNLKSGVCNTVRGVKDWTIEHRKDIALAVAIASIALAVFGSGMMVVGMFPGTTFTFIVSQGCLPSFISISVCGAGHFLHGFAFATIGVFGANAALRVRQLL